MAENAFPDNVAPIKLLAVMTSKELVPDAAVTLPVKLPIRLAVMVLAEKPPSLFLATTLPMTLEGVASTAQVDGADPSKLSPSMYAPLVR